jgi:hypothetical protein
VRPGDTGCEGHSPELVLLSARHPAASRNRMSIGVSFAAAEYRSPRDQRFGQADGEILIGTLLRRSPRAASDGLERELARLAGRIIPLATSRLSRMGGTVMDEDRFNLALRGYLKEVGVTSQREIEKVVREQDLRSGGIRLRMVLTSPDEPALNHIVEGTIALA